MKLGLHMPTMDWQGGPAELGATLGRVVEAAEKAGFDTITVADGRGRSSRQSPSCSPRRTSAPR
jgi:alkanesulfonate monooxygenase SsuD/methylene tetrahydromethanopterin reductase-like flavin-dependent oxidoreductase (luciferase family)